MKLPRRTFLHLAAGAYLGTVEAPNEKAAEAAAVAEFDSGRRAAQAAGRAACGSRKDKRMRKDLTNRSCCAVDGNISTCD